MMRFLARFLPIVLFLLGLVVFAWRIVKRCVPRFGRGGSKRPGRIEIPPRRRKARVQVRVLSREETPASQVIRDIPQSVLD